MRQTISKILVLATAAIASAGSALAQLPETGYYRIQNYNSKKYVSIVDNKVSSINYQANTADFHSIFLLKQWDAVVGNPATIIHVDKKGTTANIIGQYDLQSQATSVASMISTNVNVKANQDGTLYAYGTKSGMSIYLAETNTYWDVDEDYGAVASWDKQKDDCRKWIMTPVTSSGDCYFGVNPSIEIEGKHYATMYADFGFSTASDNMRVYTVSKNTSSKASLKELTGIIPALTPVIIECSSKNPSDNRLEIIKDQSAKPANVLKGNLFRITKEEIADAKYENLTPYKASTMRMLGITKSGKLGLVTKTGLDYLPANCAYFEAQGLDEELVLLSEEDYIADDTGIEEITVDNQHSRIYRITGEYVGNTTESLEKGVYIINGKKVAIK